MIGITFNNFTQSQKASTESTEDGKSTSEASLDADEYAGGGMGLFGLMSWISGIILLVVYTSNDHDSTIYNSFQTAIYFNLISMFWNEMFSTV